MASNYIHCKTICSFAKAKSCLYKLVSLETVFIRKFQRSMFIKMTRNFFFFRESLKTQKTRIFHILTFKDDILTRLTVQIVDRCKLFLQNYNRRFVILNYNRIKLKCSLFQKIDFHILTIFHILPNLPYSYDRLILLIIMFNAQL